MKTKTIFLILLTLLVGMTLALKSDEKSKSGMNSEDKIKNEFAEEVFDEKDSLEVLDTTEVGSEEEDFKSMIGNRYQGLSTSPTMIIIGCAIGGVILLSIIIGFAMYFIGKKKKENIVL